MILLLFPFQAELDAFIAGTLGRSETKVLGIRVFALEAEPEWRLAVCGQGKVEGALATQILTDALDPRALLLLGSATALDPALKVGDKVLADPGIEWDFEAEKPPEFRPRSAFPGLKDILSGPILSGDRNVFEPNRKAELHTRFGAKALAWEGAGFHRSLRRSGKMGWEIRVITETADEGRLTLAELKQRMARDFPALRRMASAAAL